MLTCNSRWRHFTVTPALFFWFFKTVSGESRGEDFPFRLQKSQISQRNVIFSSPVCCSPSPCVGVVFIVCLSHCHSTVVTFTPEGQIQILSQPSFKKGRGLASKGQGMSVQVSLTGESHRCVEAVCKTGFRKKL